ncbi:MAG TPA: BadF/BadG/BcrA/BcrD ATPase family protein [Methylomirabilota bacterium]|jgi:N-acetylglucosamine kinase-like BadF-type ATPase
MARRDPGALVVGVDLGATWIRVRASRGAQTVARLALPACPVHEVGKLLRKVWARRGWTRRDVAVLAVASRGIWTEAERRALAGRLVSLARRATVLSDAQAAFLGALGPGPGLLILAGTGSIVIGRDTHGRWGRAGGLGPLLGDEGSAFWLGREWLRATTRGEDFLPARRLVRSADPVARIAALAPAVVRRARRGDRRARAIVRAAHRHLADQALAVARSLRLASPVSVSWAGSVLSDRWFRAGLRVALTRAGLRARWQAPAAAPVEAAVRLAATRSGSS